MYRRRPRLARVLEGASRPDAYLATEDAIVVIEGKRTEAGPTVRTEWVTGRHQMRRHLDAAWERGTGRRVYGFVLVKGEGHDPAVVPRHWRQTATSTAAAAVLASSLPHRSAAECEEMALAFLGVATWQAACIALGVPVASPPERVAVAERDARVRAPDHE